MVNQILLIDDDREMRSEFKEQFSEYTIIEAGDGPSALKILKAPNEIDLVILDINLPGMKGIEILQHIREIAPSLIIIIQTGYGSKDIAVQALRGKANDFIEKPFDPDKARKIIERYLAKQQDKVLGAGTQAEEIVKRITSYIERNYLKKITLKDIANAVYLSPKYVSRVFKEKIKVSIGDFKLQQKIKKAKELLKTTNDSVDEISNKIGYLNTESFIRIFKKLTKQTPTEFRKHQKNK